MDGIEIADEENENYPQEDNDSDGDSSTSEKEVQLYNLIYHEHNETDRIADDVENPKQTEERPEQHISARSKVFRLNAVKTITCSPPAANSMSKSVRNQIKKVTAKLDAMKQKYSKENNEKTYSKNHFSRKNQTFINNNEKLSGRSIPSFCLKHPEADKRNEQSHDDLCLIVPNNKDCGNTITEKISTTVCSTTVCNDKVGDEREAEISKYDIILSGRSNLSTSESVIVIDSDAESVDSVIEVKPPTPPPPVVINIDSSDESSQIKEKEISTQKENIDPCQHSDTIQIDISSDAAWADSSLSADSLSTTAPAENALVVSYTIPGTGNNVLDQHDSFVEKSVDTVVKAKKRKRKRKSENSKPTRVNPGNKTLSQSVPLSWTSDMIRFYCHSWGGHKFNHEELQKQMPGNSSNWKVLEIDFLGPLPKQGPFKRARCLNCNQFGHILQQCPEPIREICCSMCGARGHTKHTCPNKICLQCGRPASTYSKGCQKCCFDTQHCTRCGQHGHYMWMCPEEWRVYHSTTSPHENSVGSKYPLKTPNEQFCCNCARRGHTSVNCKFPSYEAFDMYAAQSRSRNFSAFNYKNNKNNIHHSKFSVPNMNRKLKKNKRNNNNITVVMDPESFSRKRKKFTNTERKRIKKKQKKVLQNKMANT